MRFIYNDIKTVDGVGERELKNFLRARNKLVACLLARLLIRLAQIP